MPKKRDLKVTADLEVLSLETKKQVRNLGVVMDTNLKNISRIKHFMSKLDLKKLVHTFFSVGLTTVTVALQGSLKKLLDNCS